MSTRFAHDTLRFERDLAAPADVVFAAYADVDQRVVWSAPSDDEIVIFESHDFTVGGVDRFICGMKDDPSFAGTTRYELIVPDEVIVFSERLVTTDGQLLAMSLVTWAVEDTGSGGTLLTITDQVTSAAGDGPIDGSRHGYTAMLDQLDAFLATP
ncbi:SRPBCC domain-containing protein [Ilumatobacter sp.]|uniref:SRPBCC domain-containing protein n=1 Tax=Ilumatobacter sp. TaxID=1967498 RepID=UPI003B51EBD1